MCRVILMKAPLIFLVCMSMAALALADEEIQLAAAIGSGSTETATGGSGAIGSGKKDSAAEVLSKTADKGMSTATMVTIGVVGAGAIAAIAGSSSTSNH